MICDHARCTSSATWKTRFGDGWVRHELRSRRRQTFVHYCLPHLEQARELFVLVDVTHIPNRPNGPLRDRLARRQGDSVAR